MTRTSQPPGAGQPDAMTWEELLSACAQDRENSLYWTEFLLRYGSSIRKFIRGALLQILGRRAAGHTEAVLGGMQFGDLFQSSMLRLVEDNCAAIRRFSGKSESDWMAYLAVITRSVVRESWRRQHALKRIDRAPASEADVDEEAREPQWSGHREMERQLLAQELREFGERTIRSDAGATSDRDLLIFRLYFDHDLSCVQIARCQGIQLTKGGVQRALTRVKCLIRNALSSESS
jgi:RNA polymerase sigma factor (sigma-70 family)